MKNLNYVEPGSAGLLIELKEGNIIRRHPEDNAVQQKFKAEKGDWMRIINFIELLKKKSEFNEEYSQKLNEMLS